MIRGTTTQFKFKLPYAQEDIEWVTIKFWQKNPINEFTPITKRTADCEISADTNELRVVLTSEETFKFSDKHKAHIQLMGLHKNGTVFASRQHLVSVYPLYGDFDSEITVAPNEEGFIILDGNEITVTTDEERFVVLGSDTDIR